MWALRTLSDARDSVMPMSCSSPGRSAARTSMTVAESEAWEITIARVCPGEPDVARDESKAVARRRRASMASGSRSPPASRVSPRTRAPSSGAPPPGVSTCHSFAATPSRVRTTADRTMWP